MSKKIKSIEELQEELKKVYERVEPKTLSEFTEDENPRIPVKGCVDCPFRESVAITVPNPSSESFMHTYCSYDAGRQNIEEYVDKGNATPKDCPLQNGSITVQLV